LFSFVRVVLLLLALFGSWLVGSVCEEARFVTPFQGPFSSMCHRIFLLICFLRKRRDTLFNTGEGCEMPDVTSHDRDLTAEA
jgi:hypothetical protein